MREVPAAAAAPFKAFSALSLHLDCQLRRPEVKQVRREPSWCQPRSPVTAEHLISHGQTMASTDSMPSDDQ